MRRLGFLLLLAACRPPLDHVECRVLNDTTRRITTTVSVISAGVRRSTLRIDANSDTTLFVYGTPTEADTLQMTSSTVLLPLVALAHCSR